MTSTDDNRRWRRRYLAVVLFLLLQILLYAWFTEVWK